MYNQEYLANLIKNQKEESLNLEYKSSPSLDRKNQKKLNEISKDVSAFANSDGGILIYGITEKEHLPESIDPIDRNLVDREWLEQKIQDCIRPKIENVVIHPIVINEDPNKVVYLIEIPQSVTAHQATDKKYYKRHNFNAIAMHDYEIRDVINRVKTPKINLSFKIIERTYKVSEAFNPLGRTTNKEEFKTEYILKAYIHNSGKVYAKYVNCYIEIPEAIFENENELRTDSNTLEFLLDNSVRDFMGIEGSPPFHKEKYGPSRFEPILPKRTFTLDDNFNKLNNYYRKFLDSTIKWTLYADNSEPISGNIKIKDIVTDYEY